MHACLYMLAHLKPKIMLRYNTEDIDYTANTTNISSSSIAKQPISLEVSIIQQSSELEGYQGNIYAMC